MQVQNNHSKDKFVSNNIYDIIIENNDINNNDNDNNINSTSNESLINESNSFKNIFITNKNKFINMAKFLSNDTTCNMMFFSKTQMCKNTNNCHFGDRCKFLHLISHLSLDNINWTFETLFFNFSIISINLKTLNLILPSVIIYYLCFL